MKTKMKTKMKTIALAIVMLGAVPFAHSQIAINADIANAAGDFSVIFTSSGVLAPKRLWWTSFGTTPQSKAQFRHGRRHLIGLPQLYTAKSLGV
jgi:hypothetical protein